MSKQQDVSELEQTSQASSAKDQEVDNTTNQQEDQTSEGTQKKENAIPVSRVNEMRRKDQERVKRELLAQFENKFKDSQPINYSGAESSLDSEKDPETKQALEMLQGMIKKEVEPLKAQAELNQAMTAYPDFIDLKDDIMEVLKERPNLNYSDAYKIAKHDQVAETAREQGRQEAYQAIQQKQSGMVESGGSVTTPPLQSSGVDVWDRKKSLDEIKAEIEKMSQNN